MLKKFMIGILILFTIVLVGCAQNPFVKDDNRDGLSENEVSYPDEGGILLRVMMDSVLYRTYNKRINVSDEDLDIIGYIEIKYVEGMSVENNQSNFLPDGKYKYGTYDGMVLMYFNDDWRLLEKDSDLE